LPAVLFALLFLWPFVERGLTHDGAAHQLLDHPSDAPIRTGIGVAVLAFVGVLTLAGSDDVQANLFKLPIQELVTIYRWLLIFVPIALGVVSYLAARRLRVHRKSVTPGTSRAA
jgi:ubiquinol-cytochrome c reductase cytochrome b subunit